MANSFVLYINKHFTTMRFIDDVTEKVAADGTRYYEVEGVTLLVTEYGTLVKMNDGLQPSREALVASRETAMMTLDGVDYLLIANDNGSKTICISNE